MMPCFTQSLLRPFTRLMMLMIVISLLSWADFIMCGVDILRSILPVSSPSGFFSFFSLFSPCQSWPISFSHFLFLVFVCFLFFSFFSFFFISSFFLPICKTCDTKSVNLNWTGSARTWVGSPMESIETGRDGSMGYGNLK